MLDDIKIYEGNISKGKYNGHGLLYKDSLLHYEGYFKDNLKHGNGIIYYKDEKTIKCYGHFINNNLYYGANNYSSGELCFKGYFKNGYYKEGILLNKNGKIRFKGLFNKKGFYHGEVYDTNEKIIYIGRVLNNKPHGYGKRINNGIFECGIFFKGKLVSGEISLQKFNLKDKDGTIIAYGGIIDKKLYGDVSVLIDIRHGYYMDFIFFNNICCGYIKEELINYAKFRQFLKKEIINKK